MSLIDWLVAGCWCYFDRKGLLPGGGLARLRMISQTNKQLMQIIEGTNTQAAAS
jgi:hypothetical protein